MPLTRKCTKPYNSWVRPKDGSMQSDSTSDFYYLISIFQKSGVGQAIGNQTFIVMAFRLTRIKGPILFFFSFLNKLQYRTRKQLSCIISPCILLRLF